MKAIRVYEFGGIDSLQYEDIPRPVPGEGQVLIQVRAAGVGPWDALVREGHSALPQPLPLTPGSDVAGIVAEVGSGVTAFQPGEAVFGVTNARFTGAYAEYALADVNRIALKPELLDFIEAASVPVVGVTAWQMVFEKGGIRYPGLDGGTKRVLVQGAGGNVGAFVVQFAKRAGAIVYATALASDLEYVHSLGADQVIDTETTRFEDRVRDMDVVFDTVGGEILTRSFTVLKPGGILVSSVALPDPDIAASRNVQGIFFLVNVTSECLREIAAFLDTDAIRTRVGDVLPLSEARQAHEMLAGKPHLPGKIVLTFFEDGKS
ncbi:MAG: NADP-dependent oxidoreductase [Akkermansiaceae bacterium]|nr:NADP-dependent oxidoreductase [Armatimonadota bacterium]